LRNVPTRRKKGDHFYAVLELLLAIQHGVKRVTTFTPGWNFFSDPTQRKKGDHFYAALELLLAIQHGVKRVTLFTPCWSFF
jgi:hypothetical protein